MHFIFSVRPVIFLTTPNHLLCQPSCRSSNSLSMVGPKETGCSRFYTISANLHTFPKLQLAYLPYFHITIEPHTTSTTVHHSVTQTISPSLTIPHSFQIIFQPLTIYCSYSSALAKLLTLFSSATLITPTHFCIM